MIPDSEFRFLINAAVMLASLNVVWQRQFATSRRFSAGILSSFAERVTQ